MIRKTTPGAGLVAAAATAALAQYSITSYTIDGGGGTLTGSTYTLNGTIAGSGVPFPVPPAPATPMSAARSTLMTSHSSSATSDR